MKAEAKRKKTFDAVEFMRQRRQRRDQISKEIEGMTPKEEIQYFRKKAEEFNKQSK